MFKIAKVGDDIYAFATMTCTYNYVGIEEVKPVLESIKPDLLVRHSREL